MATGETVAAVAAPAANPQGGTLATAAGLVFHGNGDGTLTAHDAASLEPLWQINVGTPLRAPPVTYAVNGKQYIAITGGGTGTGALAELRDAPMLWVFSL